MSAKYTPGPWILATVPTSVGSCHKIGPFPNGSRVETFACVYADGIRLGIDDANPAAVQLAANARLIAAAPMMLEALQDCLTAMTALHCGSVSKADIVESARSAIAQATGEKP
jgi:hypothetical protein